MTVDGWWWWQWFTMLSNCEDLIDIDFKLTFINPGGWWYRHFSIDEQVPSYFPPGIHRSHNRI